MVLLALCVVGVVAALGVAYVCVAASGRSEREYERVMMARWRDERAQRERETEQP